MFPRFTLKGDRCPKCQRWHSLERTHRPAWVKKTFFFVKTRSYNCTACRSQIIQIGDSTDRRYPENSALFI